MSINFWINYIVESWSKKIVNTINASFIEFSITSIGYLDDHTASWKSRAVRSYCATFTQRSRHIDQRGACIPAFACIFTNTRPHRSAIIMGRNNESEPEQVSSSSHPIIRNVSWEPRQTFRVRRRDRSASRPVITWQRSEQREQISRRNNADLDALPIMK